MQKRKILVSLLVIICLIFGSFAQSIAQDVAKNPSKTVVKMEDIKQEIVGTNKEFKPGQLIKLKVSSLPGSANPITAIYKFTLLENGKKSEDLEVLTKTQKNTDPPKDGSDIIFTARCGFTGKYQLVFAATYVETKSGTSEIVRVYNPELTIYDIKISGQDNTPPEPEIPDGNFGMIRAVYLECLKLDIPKEQKKKLFENLGNSFSGMSSKIAAGIFKDSDNDENQANNINEFLRQSKDSNNDAVTLAGVDKTKLDGNVDLVVKKKLEELFDAGKMRKFAEYQAFWAEVSEGFKLAAKGVE